MNKIITIILIAVLSKTALASTFAIDKKWPHTGLEVCFKNPKLEAYKFAKPFFFEDLKSFDREQKQSIQNIVTANFSTKKTGVFFKGWKDCDVTTGKVDVIIYRGHEKRSYDSKGNPLHNGANATLGYSVENQSKEKNIVSAYVYFNTNEYNPKVNYQVKKSEKFTYTVLHEFSHIAGLAHEHDRHESRTDELCIISKLSYRRGSDSNASLLLSKKYDPKSITNYCYAYSLFFNPSLKNRFIGLSELDQKTLKCIYSDFTDEAACSEVYP